MSLERPYQKVTPVTVFITWTVVTLLALGSFSFAVGYKKELQAQARLEQAAPFTDSYGLSNTVEDSVFICRREAIKHIQKNPKATLPFVQKMFTQCMIKRKATI